MPAVSPVPPGAGGNCAGGFLEQAASAMTALAINRLRDNFIGVSFVRFAAWLSRQAMGHEIVTQSGWLGSLR
jgi:hypothetical protein